MAHADMKRKTRALQVCFHLEGVIDIPLVCVYYLGLYMPRRADKYTQALGNNSGECLYCSV